MMFRSLSLANKTALMVVASVGTVALALMIVAGWMMARDARLMAAGAQETLARMRAGSAAPGQTGGY